MTDEARHEWAVQGTANGISRLMTPWTTDHQAACDRLAGYRHGSPTADWRLVRRDTTITHHIEETP